jgi:flagellar assembly factor FliW
MMTVETRFGTFAAAEHDVIQIPGGVPAFEACTRYVLVSGPGIQPFNCLHGLDLPAPSFLVLEPRLITDEYRPPLSAMDYRRLDASAGEALLFLAIVHLASGEEATINLRAPIVVNPRRMVAIQALPYDSPYRHDHPLRLEAAHAGLHP